MNTKEALQNARILADQAPQNGTNQARYALAFERLDADARALETLRRIVKRTLACGQLEKLEDARPYLGEADQPAATEARPTPRICPGCRSLDGEHNHRPGSCSLAATAPQGAPPSEAE